MTPADAAAAPTCSSCDGPDKGGVVYMLEALGVSPPSWMHRDRGELTTVPTEAWSCGFRPHADKQAREYNKRRDRSGLPEVVVTDHVFIPPHPSLAAAVNSVPGLLDEVERLKVERDNAQREAMLLNALNSEILGFCRAESGQQKPSVMGVLFGLQSARAERDALRARVEELEAALVDIREHNYSSYALGQVVKRALARGESRGAG